MLKLVSETGYPLITTDTVMKVSSKEYVNNQNKSHVKCPVFKYRTFHSRNSRPTKLNE